MWRVTLTMMLGILMMACSEDEVQYTKMSRKLHLVMGTQNFTDVTNLIDGTRGLPDGFNAYTAHYANVGLPRDAEIQACFTTPAPDNKKINFNFSKEDVNNQRSWEAKIPIDAGTYYFYGVLPREDAGNVTFEPLENDFANGAVITLDDISAVSSADLCVVVGVKVHQKTNPTDQLPSIADLDWTGRWGQFDVEIAPTDEEKYMYLLVDHLFSSLRFKMRIDDTYNKLRTIKVKEMKLWASSTGSSIVNTIDAVVTLQKKNGTDPLIADASVTFSDPRSSGSAEPAILRRSDETPVELTTDYKDFRGCFAPNFNLTNNYQNFILDTKYDVYDKNDKLIRADQTAENKFTVHDMNRGKEHVFRIDVKPTYLYVLSDPDLDSPQFTIN